MRFISMIRVDENSGQVPSEQLMNDMGKLIDQMTREGPLIKTAGLRPTAERRIDASRVLLPEGVSMVTFTPFPPGSTFVTRAESSYPIFRRRN